MIVPSPVVFTSVPVAAVFTGDNTAFYMKCDATTYVNLGTGQVINPANPAMTVTVLPAAMLVLG